jgi:hypothetical protein
MDDDQSQNIKDKAQGKIGETGMDMNAYATRHPRRMWTGAFLVGLGSGIMASKMKREKSALQKFMDQF